MNELWSLFQIEENLYPTKVDFRNEIGFRQFHNKLKNTVDVSRYFLLYFHPIIGYWILLHPTLYTEMWWKNYIIAKKNAEKWRRF